MATAVVAIGAYAGGAGASHTDPFAFFDRLVVLGDADWKRLDGGDVAVRVLPGSDGHLGVFARRHGRLEDPARAQRYLVYVNRSQVDLLGGLFGGLKRTLIEGRLAGDSAAVMRLARSRLETGMPPSVRNPTAP